VLLAVVVLAIVIYALCRYNQKRSQGLIKAEETKVSFVSQKISHNESISKYVPIVYEYTAWEQENEISLAKEFLNRLLPQNSNADYIQPNKIEIENFNLVRESINRYVKPGLVNLTDKEYGQLNALIKGINQDISVTNNESVSEILDAFLGANYNLHYEKIRKAMRIINSCIKEKK